MSARSTTRLSGPEGTPLLGRMLRRLDVRPAESRRVLWFTLYLFCAVASMILGKTARDTFFLSRYDASLLPWAFVGAAVAIAMAVSVYNRIGRRMDPIRLVEASCLLFAVSLPPFGLAGGGVVYAMLYAWTEAIGAVMLFQFWLLANRAFTTREGKRLFGLIGAGGSAAGTVVGLSLRPLVGRFGTGWLLPGAALAILLCVWIVSVLRRRGDLLPPEDPRGPGAARATSGSPPVEMTLGRIAADPYLVTIAGIIVLSTMVGAIVDYQFKIIASETYDEAGLARLFGLLHAAIGLISLAVQTAITGRLLSRFGIIAGLASLPFVLLGGAILLLTSPVIGFAFAARVGDGVLRFTVHEAASQILWLPVRDRIKRTVKPLFDGTLRYAAVGLAGLLILLGMRLGNLRALSLVYLVLTLAWLVVILPIRKGYIRRLRDAIESRRLELDPMTLDLGQAETVDIVRRELAAGDPGRVGHVLETLGDAPLGAFANELRELLATGPPEIRRKILELARNDSSLVSDAEVVERLRAEDSWQRVEAVLACGVRGLAAAVPRLEALQDREGPIDELAAAAVALGALGTRKPEGPDRLRQLLLTGDPPVRVAVLRAAGVIAGTLPDDLLVKALADSDATVRELALEVATGNDESSVLSVVIDNLLQPSSRLDARRTLVRAPSSAAAAALLGRFERAEPEQQLVLADALLRLARAAPLADPLQQQVRDRMGEVLIRGYRRIAVREALHRDPLARPLVRQVQYDLGQDQRTVLLLEGCLLPDLPFESYAQTLLEGGRIARGNTLELLDSVLPREDRTIVVSLLEDNEARQALAAGSQLTDRLDCTPEEALRELARGGELARILVLQHMLQSTGREPSPEEEIMLSILERSLFLQEVPLFADLPGEEVWKIAQIAVPRSFAAGEEVFAEGDSSYSLFVVEQGQVRIHRGDREIAVLGPGDFFGDMALIDNLPRSASATVVAPARLLEIAQADFLALMAERAEILRGFLRVLSARLRGKAS